MAKANSRKRANKKVEPVVDAREGATPLYQNESLVFNELVEMSNQYAKLKKQYDQYEYIRVNLISRRKKIQKGEIALPVQIQLTADMYYGEKDMKKVLALFDEQIKTITNSVTAVKQQVIARRDMFIESGLRLLTFSQSRFGQYKPKEFRPRGATLTEADKKVAENEYDELFKAKVKDIKDKPEVKAAFDKARKIAMESNKKQQK